MVFLGLIILPVLSNAGMIDWWSGAVITGVTLVSLFAAKYAYVFADRWGYRKMWVGTSVIQGVLSIIASFFVDYWIIFMLIFFVNQWFFWVSPPVWNHILVQETKGNALAKPALSLLGFIVCTSPWENSF